MSNLSPHQFGFLPADEDTWGVARSNTDWVGERDLPLDTPIYTGQVDMYSDRVKHYVDNPQSEHVGRDKIDKDYPHTPPEVYHWEGKNYMGEGHHRVAAARARGDKSIRVSYYSRPDLGWD